MKLPKYYLIVLLQFLLHFGYGQNVMIDLEISAFEDFDKTMTKALSNDLKLLATYHRDNVIRIWEIESKRLLKEIKYESENSSTPVLCFSGDSKSVIAVSDQKVISWNLIDQSNLISDLPKSYSIKSVIGISGKLLIIEGFYEASTSDKIEKIYDADRFKFEVLILNDENLTIKQIFTDADAIVSSDQRVLIVNNRKLKSITRIDLENLNELGSVNYKGELTPRFISSDSKIIAGSEDGGLIFHDIAKGKIIFTLKDSEYWKFVCETNGLFVLYNYQGKIQVVDPVKSKTKIISFDDNYLPVKFTLTNNTLSISSFMENDQVFDINSGQLMGKIPSQNNIESKGKKKIDFQSVQISRDGNKFFLAEKEKNNSSNSRLHIFDVTRNSFEKVVDLQGKFKAFIPNSDAVLCGDNIYNVSDQSFKKIPQEMSVGVGALFPNENLAIVTGHNKPAKSMDLINVSEVDFPWLIEWDSIIAVSVSPDKAWSLTIKTSGKNYVTDVYFGNNKVSSDKTIWSNIKYNTDGTSILMIDRSIAGATLVNRSGGREYVAKREISGYSEGYWIVTRNIISNRIIDYDGMGKYIRIKSDSSTKRNGYGALIDSDNTLTIIDKQLSRSLKVTVLSDGQFLMHHESGLFDASENIMNQLYFVQGIDIVEFAQLKARYFEPNLLKKIISGEKLRNVVGMKSIELPPDIQVGQVDEKGYLPIELTNKGGGIGEVTVLINGKEAIVDARPKGSDSKAKQLSLKVFISNNKALIKGTENYIAVKAWNEGHWVVSRGAVVPYSIDGNENTYKPAIHIITSGVSDYTGTELDLKYAAKDAEDVSKALQLGAKKLFGTEKSYIYNLTTSQPTAKYPTKANILKAFEKVSSVAHPLDIVVVYLSGHGINHGGQDGDWYYLTQDAFTVSSTAYNDPEIRRTSTLSSNELVELFKKVPALKQVLMIDACASGKVVENLMAQKDIESTTLRALDRMRDRTGLHIITGCTADAVSYEASKYGQGVLTYSLLEGIRGSALREDQFVDVNKLFQYAHDRVPTLAEGIGGIQTPQVFSPQGGQSFDIGLLTEQEKKDIPIAKIRPVYIRSSFIDDDQLEDALQLGKKVDESLNEAASKGPSSSLIFVDVREYPDGCKLSGRYKQEGSIIKLKLRKKCEGKDETLEISGKTIEEVRDKIVSSL